MSNIHHLNTMTFTRPSANANIAPTNYMTPPADSTVASAWSSSALGDPATDDGYIADRADLPPDPISPAARRWPVGKNAVVAAAVVAALGAGTAALTSRYRRPHRIDLSRSPLSWFLVPLSSPAHPRLPSWPRRHQLLRGHRRLSASRIVGSPHPGRPAPRVMPAIRMPAVHRRRPGFLLRPTADHRPPIPAHLRPVGLAVRASLSGPMGCR